MRKRSRVLAIIVFAQFACVSLWFAGNGVLDAMTAGYDLPSGFIGHITSAVQLGFIAGTLFYAVLAFADRFSPSRVFFTSALLASASNAGLIVADGNWFVLYGMRLLTGFFLAGIYPVGMKIAADYFDKDLGKALGFLLGALVVGTAFPHLVKSAMHAFPWEQVIIALSGLAVAGGSLIFFLVPDGPYRKRGNRFTLQGLTDMFRIRNFRAAAFGYFGHMWELYAFWAFIPLILTSFLLRDRFLIDISLLSFFIIAVGGIACILGGYISGKVGSYKVAFGALALSCMCCILSPLMFTLNTVFILIFLLGWGMVVIMDSPQFSTMVAQTAPEENRGSALTIVNCIGFSITIISIQLINLLSGWIAHQWLFIFLFPGPALGLLAMLQWDHREGS